MAWSYAAVQLVLASHKTSASSWTTTTPESHGSGSVGDVGVFVLATDNVSTTDGNTTLHSTLTDSAGNTYTKARDCLRLVRGADARGHFRLDDVHGRSVVGGNREGAARLSVHDWGRERRYGERA